MKIKKIFFSISILYFILLAETLYSNELSQFIKEKTGNYNFNSYNIDKLDQYQQVRISLFNQSEKDIKTDDKNIDKLFIGIGVVTSVVGSGVLLAGLINMFVALDAVSINGEPIKTNYYVYYALIGVGSGLIVTGIPFIIVGSIRLGLKNKKIKSEISLNNISLTK